MLAIEDIDDEDDEAMGDIDLGAQASQMQALQREPAKYGPLFYVSMNEYW